MRYLVITLSLLAMTAVLMVGCQQGPQPVGLQNDTAPQQIPLFGYVMPDGAVFESATLYFAVQYPTNETVEAHRITADWGELTVTWDNFGGAYDGAVEGTFMTDVIGYRGADVSALVQAWMNGVVDNYGILLLQPVEDSPRTTYHTREAADEQPYLEICYTVDSVPSCDMLMPLADTYIWELYPADNYGDLPLCYTGFVANDEGGFTEKQTLVRFDIDVVEEELTAIGDYVWHDMNMDGYQDGDEPGIPGVTVELYTCADDFVASMETLADGSYYFGDLPAGDYYVKFILLGGYVFSPQDAAGDDALDSDADQDTGLTICVTLLAGLPDMTWDAGMYMPVQEGCTRTIGYWMNHAGQGNGNQDDEVTPLLPIWLGTAGESASVQVTSAAMAYDILQRSYCDHQENGIGKLYAQLLAAKLNFASGASSDAVDETVAAADAFLAMYGCEDWDYLSEEDQDMVLGWKTMLDDYNNGDIGPGHCEDEEEDDRFGDSDMNIDFGE